jgi:hypothetical protein
MNKIDAKLAMVVGIKDDSGGYAVSVRASTGGMVVNMLPNSAKPLVGDSIFVVITNDGNYGIALSPAAIVAQVATVNLPIDGGGIVLAAGVYVRAFVDYDCTVKAVRVILDDAAGPVADTCTFNIIRTPFASIGSAAALNSTPFGPAASSFYEDIVLSGWTVDLIAHDSLQLEIVDVPTVATAIGLALEVWRV